MPETLKAQITEAMKAALRAGDKARLSTVRLMLAEIKRIEVDERRELADAEIQSLLNRMLKQRRDAASQFRAGQREDLAAKEDAEVTVIEGFLPAALGEAEIDAAIESAVTQAEARGPQAMGQVMALLKASLPAGTDMAQVSARVKARLSH